MAKSVQKKSGTSHVKPSPAEKATLSQTSTGKRRLALGPQARAKLVQPRLKSVWFWVVVVLGAIWLAIGAFLLLASSNKGTAEQKSIANLAWQTSDVHSLAFSQTDPDTVYFGSHSGLLRSKDGGRNWQPTSLKGQDAMGMVVSNSDKTIYISGHDVFLKSEDGGQSWLSLLGRLPGSDIHAFTFDPRNEVNLYAYIVSIGLVKSNDSGQTWATSSTQLGNGTVALTYANKTIWAAVIGRGVLRSEDDGTTWQAASGFANSAINSNNRVTVLAYDIKTDGLYAGTQDGLYRSMDGGNGWTRLNYTGTVSALAINPINSKTVLLVNADARVYRSEDGGFSWSGK